MCMPSFVFRETSIQPNGEDAISTAASIALYSRHNLRRRVTPRPLACRADGRDAEPDAPAGGQPADRGAALGYHPACGPRAGTADDGEVNAVALGAVSGFEKQDAIISLSLIHIS